MAIVINIVKVISDSLDATNSNELKKNPTTNHSNNDDIHENISITKYFIKARRS